MALACFKAYDIRGQLGTELTPDLAYRLGRALVWHVDARAIVVGADVRLSSEQLKAALAQGVMDGGADVVDIGLAGTEEVYFAAMQLDVDAGVEITASHNPMDYNGMKLVRRGAVPISADSGLKELEALVERDAFGAPAASRGRLARADIVPAFVERLLGFVDLRALRPLKLVVNAGNGAAGHVVDALERALAARGAPLEFIKVHHEPDGSFPHGIPNPLLPENRQATAQAVREHGADIGIAWDGDFDRCFLFDERGEFIEGYYIVGLLAEAFVLRHPGAKIIHDTRLMWNTVEVARRAGGVPVQSKCGHAFIKERMRVEDAVYGGEMSAHHYFRDFGYCDSGMIPWLLVCEMMSRRRLPLSQLVGERIAAYPCSGEINFRVADAAHALQRVRAAYAGDGPRIDEIDGLGMEFADWRFNLRSSNTEPLLRLNVEARNDASLVMRHVEELRQLIGAQA